MDGGTIHRSTVILIVASTVEPDMVAGPKAGRPADGPNHRVHQPAANVSQLDFEIVLGIGRRLRSFQAVSENDVKVGRRRAALYVCPR
ncbi:MAG: hypothetical protein M5U12_37895 [Verrucomicrobia bacterium]|nr:hypothetical protein [Verrucomicrobiota bacterium]